MKRADLPMPLMIAACSNRKRPPPKVHAADLAVGSTETIGRDWVARLSGLPRQPAAQLYCGRSVRDAERAARSLGADLLFASAGLGWIRATDLVPSYGMTIVARNDNVLDLIEGEASAEAWWRWLKDASPFGTSLADAVAMTSGLVLVALPRAYLAMVEADLLALPERQRNRLRIIQRRSSVRAKLQAWTLTYDDRLEAGDKYAGTRADFAARAARHFVERVLPGHSLGDARAHEDAVQNALAAWTATPVRVGLRRSDSDLRRVVERHWDQAEGRTTRLLRILRDDLGIACEQGRFARLVSAMRAERTAVR